MTAPAIKVALVVETLTALVVLPALGVLTITAGPPYHIALSIVGPAFVVWVVFRDVLPPAATSQC